MRRIWLHIGAPKTGTTALQHAFNDNRDALNEAGLSYITPGRKSSANPVAVALNRGRTDEIRAFADELSEKIEATTNDCLISSELFFARPPDLIAKALPALSPENTTILVWLKRQDLYLESKYLQRAKNARFDGTIWDYIERFDGSGADYEESLAGWTDAGFKIEARISDRPILDDALDVLGLNGRIDLPQTPPVNSSPSQLRLDLLQAAADAGHPNPRRLQRSLPPDTGPKARILSNAERKTLLAGYAASNERMRQRFFPDRDALFDTSDLDLPDPPNEAALSDRQIQEISQLLRTFRETLG